MTPRTLFRALALAETVTWTLLIVGMLLKYVVRVTDVGVSIGGGLHGFFFLAFVAAAVVVAVNQRWGLGTTVVALASAVVPYATIPAERWLEKRGSLDGGWRREATGHPHDSRLVNRLLRWALANTVLFAASAVAVVVAVFALLLVVGPAEA
ncbi:integral membrane protein [Conyzicola lurida]|uniref:Integral membrane protein n=1 Tax=Conyzicola lurida TaxID=1172621 RepID=A0A841AU04_9MICO|nr:integral membrane protein [Conyzicola lurida]